MNSPANQIDQAAAHRHFSVSCFNAAWGLIDKTNRTAEDDENMVTLAHVSMWHWKQRTDCSTRNLSIGYWQLSRVYALIGKGEEARDYGQRCLSISQEEEPFYLGYAYESLARAAMLLNDRDDANDNLQQARKFAEAVENAEEQKLLLADLDAINP